MNRLKLSLRTTALVATYGLACTDPRAFSLHPAQLPTRAVHATAAAAGSGQPRGALSQEQIASVIRAATPSLNHNCWAPLESASANQAATEVRLIARLAIEPSGRVSALDIREASAAYPELTRCLVEELLSLGFADGTIGTHVSVPIVFARSDEQGS